MHPKAAESVVERLTYIAQNLLYPQGHLLAGQKILDVAGETSDFTYTDEGRVAEREVLKQLLGKYRWGEKLSETYLNGRLTDIFHQVVTARSTAPVAKSFGRLVAEYEGLWEKWLGKKSDSPKDQPKK